MASKVLTMLRLGHAVYATAEGGAAIAPCVQQYNVYMDTDKLRGDGSEEADHVETVAISDSMLCATTAKGHLLQYGSGFYGEGLECDESMRLVSAEPSQPALRKVKFEFGAVQSVALGSAHVVAVTASGDAYTWGHDSHGQLGQGSCKRAGCCVCSADSSSDATTVRAPFRVLFPSPAPKIAAVSCGKRHTLFLSSDGCVLSCGDGHLGQLGVRLSVSGATTVASSCCTPQIIPAFSASMPAASISAGEHGEFSHVHAGV